MGHEYHPNAKTTLKIRKEIRECDLPAAEAAEKFNVNINTIYKWRNRDEDDLEDRSHATGVKSRTLTEFERHLICEVKKLTLFSIDDLVEVLQPFIENINRDNVYVTLKQEGLNRNDLIQPEEDRVKKGYKKFKNYKPGYLHIDVKYLPKIDGERKYLFVAIDRKTRLVYMKVYDEKTAESAEDFLERVIEFYPFRINKILTDNGKEFTDRFRKNGDKKPTGNHIFDKKCTEHNIEHRLIKPYRPQTNGMVERFNRRVDENILDRFTFENHRELENIIYQYGYTYNRFITQKKLDYLSPCEYTKKHYIEDFELKSFNNYNQEQQDN